jgi:chorismate--pyruvate lyase
MTECFLVGEEIRKLNRDLRILVATDGTLTRMLGTVAGEEIFVEVVQQQIHRVTPKAADNGPIPAGRVLRRHVLLTGRSSGQRFVAAESLIAVDVLPPAITASLTKTDRPIGEVVAASRLETFKEAADVWIAELPAWLTGYRDGGAGVVTRRYRIMTAGRPVMVITEYFLRDEFSL